jgi:transcriptional regulator with GAF, ATPase, and Fis domain
LQVLREVIEITIFSQASILLVGESGTGKELLAHLVHQLDRQKDKRDLVIVDCTTIVPELAGSEFFGHERGAFTGAVAPRDGAFALANGGTLFLDEISELPLPLQAQLLRVIQERTFKRVGGNEWKQTDFRLICATNKELSVEIERGRFRRDLYYRIATAVCHVPALRERTEDILLLLDHFSRRARPSDRPLRFEPVVTHFLLEREYPGNVRELRQLISRIMLSHPGDGAVTAGDIPPAERNRPDGEIADWCSDAFTTCIYRALCRGVGMREVLRRTRTEAIHLAMKLAGGNKKVAADRLGTTNRTVQMHLARQGRDDP